VKPQHIKRVYPIRIKLLLKGEMMQSFIRKPSVLMASLFVGLLGATSVASAQSLQIKQWAASCSACHGTDGYSEGGMASLAGQNKAEMIKKMNEYKTGKRTASIMHQLSKGYTDEQIEQISAYFASLPAEKPVAKTK
jgi:cytochrome subunit of sulfide dehydrogenase